MQRELSYLECGRSNPERSQGNAARYLLKPPNERPCFPLGSRACIALYKSHDCPSCSMTSTADLISSIVDAPVESKIGNFFAAKCFKNGKLVKSQDAILKPCMPISTSISADSTSNGVDINSIPFSLHICINC